LRGQELRPAAAAHAPVRPPGAPAAAQAAHLQRRAAAAPPLRLLPQGLGHCRLCRLCLGLYHANSLYVIRYK